MSIDAALQPADRSYVFATGQATIAVPPDQATVEVGVITQASTASAAAAQNAKQTEAVVTELRKLIKTEDRLRTTRYSLGPSYRTPKPGEAQTITGYRGSNTVEVTLNDLSRVGTIIDAALKAGANNVQGLRFELKNPQAARSEALREATRGAKANAEAIADGLGLRITRIISAEEYLDSDVGFARKAPLPLAFAADVETPVEPGAVEVEAAITLKAEVSQ